jgi:ATP:ADP antiporter, AAA family
VGAVSAGAMIAQQVAGKAARDAFYLSQFDVRTLPFVMAASAVLSLATMWWVALLMVRHSPARVVPIAFGLSGAAFLAEWALCFVSPQLAAIALYLHTALFGGVIVSAFWSLINETFVPHWGRGAMSWIAGGGALGGALGGIAVWRAAGHIDVPTMLPILAVVNLICFWGVLRLGRAPGATTTPKIDGVAEAPLAPLRLLRDTPYLRSIALVVLLGAVLSGILDYVFSAQAVRTHGNGDALLAFFALFWLIVGLASFGLQVLLGRLVLDKLGLAVTVALLSGVVVVGGAMALAFPRLWTMAFLRGGEASQRNSLFRAAYELLYTPLAEAKKRAAKLIIDVGFDRIGTMSASVIVALVLLVAPPATAEPILLVVAMGCALVTLTQTRALHRGYVALLEDNLRTVAQELERPASSSTVSAVTKVAIRDELVTQLDELRAEDPQAFARVTGEPHPSPEESSPPTPAAEEIQRLVQHARDLTCGDVARARDVLRETVPLPSPLIGFVVLLLGDKDLHLDAIRALREVAARATGQLVDVLCDPSVPFDIRRRIPRALSRCPTQQAADGLFRGLDDERFEVRYACGRALLRLRSSDDVMFDLERIVAAVDQEGKRVKAVWNQSMDDDEEDGDATDLFGRLLHDQIDRSLEHIFNILAMYFDPASLRTAFNALHADDDHLRGTALEYLDTVLPPEVRELVWPFLGAERPMRPARPAQEILEDINRASEARKES